MASSLSATFGPRGPLAKRLTGFAPRVQQTALAETLATSLNEGTPCLAEAGTGVGKTMAYLVPLLRWLEKTQGRAIVSTHTLALQSQLIERDIPAVLAALESPIEAAVLKGRQNFLCWQELEIASGELWAFGDPLFKRIQRWSSETDSGDVAELDFSFPAWSEVAASADTCRQRECRHFERCFYYKAKKQAEGCQLLVVNHALFFADLRLRRQNPDGPSLLPAYDAVVFDEAHHVEDTAVRAFGLEWGSRRVPILLARCKRLPQLKPQNLATIEALHQRLLDPFLGAHSPEGFLHEVDAPQFDALRDAVGLALDALAKDLAALAEGGNTPTEKDKATGLARSASRLSTELAAFHLKPQDESYFLWYQTRRTRTGQVFTTLTRTPYEVAEPLEESLYRRVPRVTFVSATLATGGGFESTKKRLGLEAHAPQETLQGSPFDYEKNCLLYIPRHLGPPASTAEYAERSLQEIRELITLARGRTFVLFTSHRMLSLARERLAQDVGYPLFAQGELPNARLIESFVASGNGVLLGTSSFWEGVDVPGEALSLVILDKLPFPTPDAPPLRAREERIKAAGGDAFSEFSLPTAELRLKQGFGRLLRTPTDRGVVAILDTRLWTKNYGRQLLGALPPGRRTESLAEVASFFAD